MGKFCVERDGSFYGPFNSFEDAKLWADTNGGDACEKPDDAVIPWSEP